MRARWLAYIMEVSRKIRVDDVLYYRCTASGRKKPQRAGAEGGTAKKYKQTSTYKIINTRLCQLITECPGAFPQFQDQQINHD